LKEGSFNEHAENYDGWFLKNKNVLESEVLLLKYFLSNPGKAVSIGCGSGLFEYLLKTEHGIEIGYGVEPSKAMARIAQKRGIIVKIGTAESLPFGDEEFDTAILNGVLSYVDDPKKALEEAYRVLKYGGYVVVACVPAESSYGMLYKLAELKGGWDDPYLKRIAPRHPYPIEFVREARWCTIEEASEWLKEAGFVDLRFAQTLTRHPKYSDNYVEQATEGYERGDYVAIKARKPIDTH